ncbi:hypothetical protein RAS1_26860 [Phycisphaerae bacterium RAS1]|nr:hypothetical protein RAS1_26860 [Phycisphaerae bacterium RAS1]
MSNADPADRPDWAGFARDVIEADVRGGDATRVAPPDVECGAYGGVFVTLHKFGRLRGCMGTLDAARPLAEAVRTAAIRVARDDPRFPPVGVGELQDIELDVSILSPPWPMTTIDELELGRHGILVQSGERRGLFLPQVATEHHMSKESFLSRCAGEKAGLAPDAWRDPATQVLLFTADVYAG